MLPVNVYPCKCFLTLMSSCMNCAHKNTISPLLSGDTASGVLLLLLFTATRILFILQGGSFIGKTISFAMQYLDPILLRTDLLASLFYQHSQPPLFNFFLGMGLKVTSMPSVFFEIVFKTAGALTVLMFFGTLVSFGIRHVLALFLTVLFMVNPTLILYENLLYYTYIEGFFIISAIFFLVRWGHDRRLSLLLLFWSSLLCLGLTRSLFHPFFFLVITFFLWLYLRKILSEKRSSRIFLLSSFIALIPLFTLCSKNYSLYGFFGTSSWSGMSMWTKVNTCGPDQLETLHKAGTVSLLGVKAELQAFKPVGEYFNKNEIADMACHHQADCNEFKSTGKPNFNHIGYVFLSRQLWTDSLSLIALRPTDFAFYTLASYSLTLWHSSDSVHALFEKNMSILKNIERFYRFLNFEFLGVKSKHDKGMWLRTIVMTLILMFFYAVTVLNSIRKNPHLPIAVSLCCLFCLLVHGYTLLVSSLIEFGENNRFRFPVDSALLLLMVGSAMSLGRSLKRHV